MRSLAHRVARSLLIGGVLATASPALASEGGLSFYVEGQSVPDGGVLPAQGFYFDSTTWLYNTKIGANRTTQIGGNVVAEVKANIVADFVTGLWVTPVKLFGGDLAFALVVPFGTPAVRAGIVRDGPLIERVVGRAIGAAAFDATFNSGDPIVSTSLGWHVGNWHWKVSGVLSIPAGAYEPGELSNVALNRYVGDVSAAVTHLDLDRGTEFSVAAGFTFNGTNPATRYTTGKEFHIDVSASKYLTKELSVGIIASHYQQLTGDSGAGNRLGAFKGRVTAVGGTVGLTVPVGQVPVSTRIKVLREVEVENRFQGTIGFLEVSFPLWVAPPTAAPERPVSAKF